MLDKMLQTVGFTKPFRSEDPFDAVKANWIFLGSAEVKFGTALSLPEAPNLVKVEP